ncbi:antitermination protein [Escherichia coli]
MSTKLTGYVWDGCAASGMKLSSVAIMARLADFSNDEGVCWPSIETIARQIGAGMSTVRTAIARLEAEGWLTRKARRQGNRNASNVYQLNVAKLQAAAFSQLSDSDPSKSDASKSDPSKFDASKSGKKAGFHPSESGGDPSVKSKHDPSDKKTSRPDASQPDTQTAEQEFLTRHPDAVVFSPKKRQWGTQDDLTCAQWLWKKIIALYEQAAECDGEVVRPKEPNWTAWANEIRLKELCQHCHGKGEVSTACRGCKGKGIVLDEKRTRLHGTPVYKICGRCNGNRFSRLPTTLARRHVQKLVPDLTDYQWYKGYADVIDKLVTKCWQEEAYAETQLRKVTR